MRNAFSLERTTHNRPEKPDGRRAVLRSQVLELHGISHGSAGARSIATAFAGPRYTSMLDVVTNAHVGLDFFGGTGDFREWYETSLTPIVREFHSLNGYGRKSLDILGETVLHLPRH